MSEPPPGSGIEPGPQGAFGEQIRDLEQTLASLRGESEVAHVLLGLSSTLAEVRSVEETLEKAVRSVAEIFGADRAFAATLTPDRKRLELRAQMGYEAEDLAFLRELAAIPGGLTFLRSAIKERTPVFVPDTEENPALDPEVIKRRGVRAFIGIPITRYGEDFGGLVLEFPEPRRFTQRDVSLVRGIARQVGVAMTNSRRFTLLGGLRAFGLSLGSKLSLTNVMEQVTRGAASLLSGDLASVYFLDSTNRSLVAGEALDGDPELGERFAVISLESGPWRALGQGRSILVRDLGTPESPLSAVAAPIPGELTPLLGAVIVFFRRALKLAPDETEALSVLAGQAGMAIDNANRFERQRRVARSLQAGLLSTEMPQLEGFEIAAVYEPASGEADIGGDFYDVFGIGADRFAVVVGDVSGKGAEAAARTAMAKYMLRAFAMRNSNPSSALFHLNNALAQDLEADRFATLVYGLYDVPSRRWTIARAGHPPPLLYRASTGTVEVYEELQGGILGAFPELQFAQESFVMERGDVFLLYTDGLIEARSEAGGFYGRRRIEQGLARYGGDLPPHLLTLRLYEDAQQFGVVGDDTVVFAVRCVT